jgi:hypothetical protein
MEREVIRAKVKEYFTKNFMYACGDAGLMAHESEHIIDCATSMYCTKHNIGYPGGSFVQAVVNNDLMGAMSYADDVNQRAIKFYTVFLYNFSPY